MRVAAAWRTGTGWVVTSERELRRIEVPAQIDDGRLSLEAGSGVLGPSRRQPSRLPARDRAEGAPAIRRRARGRASNDRIHLAMRDHALALIREGYGPPRTHARPRPSRIAMDWRSRARRLADVDGGGQAVAPSSPMAALRSAPSPTRATGRARADPWLRAPVVRGPRAARHAAGLRGRRHERDPAGPLRARRDDVRYLRGARGAPQGSRPSRGLLLGQAHRVTPARTQPARRPVDAVRTGPHGVSGRHRGAAHSSRAEGRVERGEPHAPGPPREGAAPRGPLGHGDGERDAPGLRRRPRRPLRQDAGAPRRPAPAPERRARSAGGDPVPARPRLTSPGTWRRSAIVGASCSRRANRPATCRAAPSTPIPSPRSLARTAASTLTVRCHFCPAKTVTSRLGRHGPATDRFAFRNATGGRSGRRRRMARRAPPPAARARTERRAAP